MMILPADSDSAEPGHQVLLDSAQTTIMVIASRDPSHWSIYTIRVTKPIEGGAEPAGVNFPADPSTPGRVAVGGSVTGYSRAYPDRPWDASICASAESTWPGLVLICGFFRKTDNDWYGVMLEGDRAYQVDLQGGSTGNGTLRDPFIFGIYDSDGAYIPGTMDNSRGPGEDARVIFSPPTDETGAKLYFISAKIEHPRCFERRLLRDVQAQRDRAGRRP